MIDALLDAFMESIKTAVRFMGAPVKSVDWWIVAGSTVINAAIFSGVLQ